MYTPLWLCKVPDIRTSAVYDEIALEPVVVDVEEHHLRLRRLEDQVAELLDLEAGLEGELQLRALDHDVWEVEQVHLERPLQLSEQRLGRRCEDLSEATPRSAPWVC